MRTDKSKDTKNRRDEALTYRGASPLLQIFPVENPAIAAVAAVAAADKKLLRL